MKETKLLGKLLPTHPDILPVFNEIREKYRISPLFKFHKKVTP
jgi:hypothetical protein